MNWIKVRDELIQAIMDRDVCRIGNIANRMRRYGGLNYDQRYAIAHKLTGISEPNWDSALYEADLRQRRRLSKDFHESREEQLNDCELLKFEDYLRLADKKNESGFELVRGNGEAVISLGDIFITEEAADALGTHDAVDCLLKHQNGDWGRVGLTDEIANKRAATSEGYIHSLYVVADKTGYVSEFVVSITTDTYDSVTTVREEDLYDGC